MIESKNDQITNDKRLRLMEMRSAEKAGLEIAKDAGRRHHVAAKNEISPWETSNNESKRVTRMNVMITRPATRLPRPRAGGQEQ